MNAQTNVPIRKYKKRMFGNNINMGVNVQILMSSCRDGLKKGLTTTCKNIKYMFDSKKGFKLKSGDVRIKKKCA